MLSARIIDKYSSHRLGGRGKEVGPPLPLRIISADQSNVSFMNQCGGLKRVSRRFLRQFSRSNLAKLLIDHWQQFARGTCVAFFNGR